MKVDLAAWCACVAEKGSWLVEMAEVGTNEMRLMIQNVTQPEGIQLRLATKAVQMMTCSSSITTKIPGVDPTLHHEGDTDARGGGGGGRGREVSPEADKQTMWRRWAEAVTRAIEVTYPSPSSRHGQERLPRRDEFGRTIRAPGEHAVEQQATRLRGLREQIESVGGDGGDGDGGVGDGDGDGDGDGGGDGGDGGGGGGEDDYPPRRTEDERLPPRTRTPDPDWLRAWCTPYAEVEGDRAWRE